MADRPIIFSGPMVQALLQGHKTQTRRVAKIKSISGEMVPIHPPEELIELSDDDFHRGEMHYASTSALSGPYPIRYAVGDRLYVRETFRAPGGGSISTCTKPEHVEFRATPAEWVLDEMDLDHYETQYKWRPAIHMPRDFSRLTLVVTDIRVQPLQDISETDAQAEGVKEITTNIWKDYSEQPLTHMEARDSFKSLWQSLNGKREGATWSDNPWVVAVTFDVEQNNIDQMKSAA